MEIKKAFLSLAKIYHPDVNKAPGAKEKFAEILEAYDILSDESKREVYDKSGLTAAQQEDLEFEAKKNILKKGFYEKPVEYSSDEEDNITQEEEIKNIIENSEKIFGPKINKKLSSSYTSIFDEQAAQDEFDNRDPCANLSAPKDYKLDIKIDLLLSFIEAVKGCTKTIKYKKNTICADCKGEYCE